MTGWFEQQRSLSYLNAILAGALLNSALFLSGVFIAGLVFHEPLAVIFALASAGMAFLSYLSQMNGYSRAGTVINILSIACGTYAGTSLLFVAF